MEGALTACGLNPDARAQDLSLEQWVALSWELHRGTLAGLGLAGAGEGAGKRAAEGEGAEAGEGGKQEKEEGPAERGPGREGRRARRRGDEQG